MPAPQVEQSTALAVRSSADLAAVEELEKILLTGEGASLNVEEDPIEIARSIMAQILSAEDDAGTFEAFGDATGWRELLDVPVELHGFRWRPSQFDEGGGQAVFFVVEASRMDRETPEKVILTTGSGTVLAQLTNLAKRGELVGKVVVLVEGERTKAGYTPLQLRQPKASDSTEASF